MGYIFHLKDSCQRPLQVVGVTSPRWEDCVLQALGLLGSQRLGRRISCVEIFSQGAFVLRLMASQVREPVARQRSSIVKHLPRVAKQARPSQLLLEL